ncbi:hypothetical protein ACO0QE_003013 [Hanseniaspora vineae]
MLSIKNIPSKVMSFVWLTVFLSMLVNTTAKINMTNKPQSQDNYPACAIYDQCGKKSLFGQQLPCPKSSKFHPPKASSETLEIVSGLCGEEWLEQEYLCCTTEQAQKLEENIKKVENIIASCPACFKNFKNLFCSFTCSPTQRSFVNVTKTQLNYDKTDDIVTELDVFMNPEWASEFYDSCKNVKFGATNGYAMDLIGGGAKNYTEFLKFLGDEKPLLGGSPFQMNYVYNVSEADGFKLYNETKALNCSDPDYKCTCSDCFDSCPDIKDAPSSGQCKVGNVPCFSVGVVVAYFCVFIGMVVWHVRMFKQKNKSSQLLTSDSNENDGNNYPYAVRVENTTDSLFDNYSSLVYHKPSVGISKFFGKIASFCTLHCKKVLISSVSIIVLFIIFMFKFGKLELNPINLWVSPNSKKYQEKQFFDENFGPFYRAEQIFVINETGPVLQNYETLKWWFEVENYITGDMTTTENVGYNDLCFRPTEDFDCVTESYTQYFHSVLPDKSSWQSQLQMCAESPVNCLPTFQQPLKANLLFSNESFVLDSHAFVVTLLVDEHSDRSVEWEKALEKYLLSLELPKGLRLSFNTEMSLEKELAGNNDVWVVVASYLIMFLYSSWALNKSAQKTGFILGLCGILIVLSSITSAAGLLSALGLKSTLIIAEVIPFLILAIGVDNIFLIVNEYRAVDKTFSIEERIAFAVERISPSISMSFLSQFICFLLAGIVPMPAVRNFALYSATALLFNVIFQLTTFISILTIYEQYTSKISLPDENEDENNDENDEKSRFSDFYHTLLLKFRGVVLGISITIAFAALFFIPSIKLGLDQTLAVPQDSYLVQYFNDVYKYLNVGPPVYFVVKDVDVSTRDVQKRLCGKYTTCDEYSLSNVLEVEKNYTTITEPVANWLDDYFMFLNPSLDSCCRFKRGTSDVCPPRFPTRMCQTCFADDEWSYDMQGFPEGSEFMQYFDIWINTAPSDACPLGGEAPYSKSIRLSNDSHSIKTSYFRSAHSPLRSQDDYIQAYKDAEFISSQFEDLNMFAYSPIYIFFVQYASLVKLTLSLLAAALCALFVVSKVMIGSTRTSVILVLTVTMILIDIGGFMYFAGITLNAVSLVNLVICVGISVEFCIHIVRKFTFIDRDTEINNNARVLFAMKTVGKSVFWGITLTKIIGVSVLSFAKSKIFEVFYFRMWFALIIISSVHALVVLPVMLSMYGGKECYLNN